MDKNLFVFVTESGTFFDRTNGKNKRLFPNESINLETGVLYIGKSSTGGLYVISHNNDGNQIYKKDISNPGLYMITTLFVQPMVKSVKEVRNLYNRLKTSLGKPNFRIEVNPKLRQSYKVRMDTWLDKGFHYRFFITTKEENVSLTMVEEIYELVNRASKLDLKMLLTQYGAFNKNGISVTINEEFFETMKVVMAGYKETATALQ